MIRNAKMDDAQAILNLVNFYAEQGLMLKKCPYDIYRNVQGFMVYEENGHILGCVRAAVVWKDFIEVASLAVHPDAGRKGIGRQLVEACIKEAEKLGVPHVFSLTYQCEFFAKCGFREIERETLPHKVFGDCLSCAKVDCCDEHAFIRDV